MDADEIARVNEVASYLDRLEGELLRLDVDMQIADMDPPSVVADRLRAILALVAQERDAAVAAEASFVPYPDKEPTIVDCLDGALRCLSDEAGQNPSAPVLSAQWWLRKAKDIHIRQTQEPNT